MSIICQTWDIKHVPDKDQLYLTNKIWSPCKVGECHEDPLQIEYLPGFIIQGFYSPKLEVIVPHRIVLNKINNWPEVSMHYMLKDYPPFLFYIPDWNIQTKSPAEVFISAWNRYRTV